MPFIEVFKDTQWVTAASIQVLGNDRCRVDYVPEYVFGDAPMPLALGMPVAFQMDQIGENGQPDRRPPSFLYDLVPQGRGRRFLIKKMGWSDSDELVLPLLLKGAFNPVGCLRIDEAVSYYKQEAQAGTGGAEGFTMADMTRKSETFLEHLSLHAMLAAGTTGVQGVAPKFLLNQDAHGMWFADLALEDSRAKSHWIVKLPRGRSEADHVVHRNEAAYLRLAAKCGIRTNEPPMLHGEMLFIRRFDRRVTAQGLQRLHQESLASVAGLRGFGVPTTQNTLLSALRQHVSDPLGETIEFLKRDVLNMAMRNTDNHARNTALQRLPSGAVQLTPLFDFAPMFYDPEIVPRSVNWHDRKGKRIDGWQHILECLDLPDVDLVAIGLALKEFGGVIAGLENLAVACGVEPIVLDQCLRSIERQARELIDIQVPVPPKQAAAAAPSAGRRPRV